LREKVRVFGLAYKPAAIAAMASSSRRAEFEQLGAEIKRSALRTGYIMKRAQHKPSWRRRWFVLTEELLAYFESPAALQPSGLLLLSEVQGVSEVYAPTMPTATANGTGASSSGGDTSGGGGGGSAASSGRESPSPGSARGSGSGPLAMGRHHRSPSVTGGGATTAAPGVPVPPDIADMLYIFVVHTPGRTYALQAASTRDRARWIAALRAAARGDFAAVINAQSAAKYRSGARESNVLTVRTGAAARPSSAGGLGGGSGGGAGTNVRKSVALLTGTPPGDTSSSTASSLTARASGSRPSPT
jgi:hypothetical protein